MSLTTHTLVDGGITVEWNVPVLTYGRETYYVIYWIVREDLDRRFAMVYNATTLQLDGLLANTTYFYKVVAKNAAGIESSIITSFRTN